MTVILVCLCILALLGTAGTFKAPHTLALLHASSLIDSVMILCLCFGLAIMSCVAKLYDLYLAGCNIGLVEIIFSPSIMLSNLVDKPMLWLKLILVGCISIIASVLNTSLISSWAAKDFSDAQQK